jgi:hypothetical protein
MDMKTPPFLIFYVLQKLFSNSEIHKGDIHIKIYGRETNTGCRDMRRTLRQSNVCLVNVNPTGPGGLQLT